MKKVNTLVLGLVVLLAFGCGGDEETVTPENDKPAPENFSKCQLIKDRVDTLTSRYAYDAQGRLISKTYAAGKEIFEYNALGKLSKAILFYAHMSDTVEVRTYEYSSDSLLVRWWLRSGATPAGVIHKWGLASLAYDAQKRIVSRFSHDVNQPATIILKTNYMYLTNNKVKGQTWELTPFNTWQLVRESETVYDNHKTPLGSDFPSKSLVVGDPVDHNQLSHTITLYGPNPQPQIYSYTTTHTYNAAGYPTQSIRTVSGQNPVITNYTYNCQ